MFDNFQICPYTGLRSFTEEESLYFKGREDDIDQATIQLQKNKFLMLTGASGDGKSSLIYAGIIPNARSGFLKSKYSQWCVADFRPERTPFQNLCKSLAKQLDIDDINTVEAELNHGFSALVDLYRNSKRHLDNRSEAWLRSDDKGKAGVRRDAANLIVLVDQFEEFFTNPENYHHGVPSRESNLVLNLLLETARIALEEDLPIYVVFTMRSDYIGQCAAFRGLPEYLGFSQFFVPRLNRSQLQQVIEEPAKLSGNRITRRLTERLIHDITEGVDQLPILQHALNQIWVAADHGNEEMDLLHYAMVGGMSVSEIPEEQVSRFENWFSALPPHIKKCYHEPNLQNVLDTHTNKLYEQAAGYYGDKTGKSISGDEAKRIIRTAFTCLTKIDQSRAVRNRMTLQEITNILGSEYNASEVGAVVNIFREPGNTFIHPFIVEEDPGSQQLQPDIILDITHESLIRNWKYLGQWAKEEYDSRSISLDFEQQLGRWVSSNKSKDFLLSIGPLTFFENWFNKAKPNDWWIARYLPGENTREAKLKKAGEILANAREFLKQSASKHAITRTVMRYGSKRIAATLALIAFLTLTSFAVRNYLKQQNASVLASIKKQSLEFARDPKVTLYAKAVLLSEELKQGQNSVTEIMNAVPDTIQKINLANAMASLFIFQGMGTPVKEIDEFITISDSLLNIFPAANNSALMSSCLKENNDLRAALELDYKYRADPKILAWKKRCAARAAKWVLQIVEKQPAEFNNIQELSLALEYAIQYNAFSSAEMERIITILSPYENSERSSWLLSRFSQELVLERGELGYGFFFNGLYQELAYLYAAKGNSERALQCIDTLLKYNQNYYQGDYGSVADNAMNIAGVFFSSGHAGNLDAFVQGYCSRKKITEVEFYDRMTARMAHERATAGSLDLLWWMDNKINLNTRYSSNEQIGFFFRKYRERIAATVPNIDERNLLTALAYKNEGIIRSMNNETLVIDKIPVKIYFDSALVMYRQVSDAYLMQQETIIGISGADQLVTPKKTQFIYPDFRPSFHPTEPRSFYHFYTNDQFLDYILSNGLFDSFYPGMDELKNISSWLNDYNVRMFNSVAFMASPIRTDLLQKLASIIEKRKAEQSQDFNLLFLELGKNAQDSGKQELMLEYYRKVQPNNLLNILRTKEYANNVNNRSFRLIAFAVKGFVQTGHMDEAYKVVSAFKKTANRSSLYAFAAGQLAAEKADPAVIDVLLDSSKVEMQRTQNVTAGQPNRAALAYALGMQDPVKNSQEINALIKNLPEKLWPIRSVARTFAFNRRLYQATEVIPTLISDDDRAGTMWAILFDYGRSGAEPVNKEWKTYQENYYPYIIRRIDYQDESN